MLKKSTVITCLILVGSLSLMSQTLSPRIFVSTSYLPSVSLSDTTGFFGDQSASIGFSVPVYGKLKEKEGGPSLFLLLLNGKFEMARTELGRFDERRLFVKPWIGTSWLYHNGRKSTFIGNFRIRWIEDEYSGNDTKPFPVGLFMWRIKKSEKFSYLLGATYTYNFGSGFPFPILGFNHALGAHSRMSMILPLFINIQKDLINGRSVSLFFRPGGDVSRFGNNGIFEDGADDTALLRQRAIKMGGSYSFIWQMLKITPEVGWLCRRELIFSNNGGSLVDPDDIYSTGIAPSLYFQLKIGINLGGSEQSGPLQLLNSELMGF